MAMYPTRWPCIPYVKSNRVINRPEVIHMRPKWKCNTNMLSPNTQRWNEIAIHSCYTKYTKYIIIGNQAPQGQSVTTYPRCSLSKQEARLQWRLLNRAFIGLGRRLDCSSDCRPNHMGQLSGLYGNSVRVIGAHLRNRWAWIFNLSWWTGRVIWAWWNTHRWTGLLICKPRYHPGPVWAPRFDAQLRYSWGCRWTSY
jgi:hypothetical protein